MCHRRARSQLHVEPVYTLDADIVLVGAGRAAMSAHLQEQGYRIEEHPYSLNAFAPVSDLRIQFTTDERYQAFLPRSIQAEILGIPVRVACLEDITQGKLWAWSDPQRLSKRKKEELDLIRLAEGYPELKSSYPTELQEQLDRNR